MIELKNVSKFYYQNGIIASGFSKINLKLNIGEFVVITGESGSGKSTLLNVISGLDTYEEGEMYINGEETSHYTEKDFEDYRRKYIGNIFQNFNLVNSYTVYQNIELVLLLNGEKKKNVKEKVLNIIDIVGLNNFKNTKVSKLSGGQKQRVAIARALAKETPVIVADEPTGNLDTKSARQIMKLLHEISASKLVVIVTHNKEQVEEYATRLITMHDGRIIEDKVSTKVGKEKDVEIKEYKNITILNRIRLGIRNTFNIFTKFALILFVFFFVASSILFEYASFKKKERETTLTGSNFVFRNNDTKRIVIQKNDRSLITEDEIDKIKKLDHVARFVENDTLLDAEIALRDSEYHYYISGFADDINVYDGDITYGRMPENDYEILAIAGTYDWYLTDDYESVLEKELFITNPSTGMYTGIDAKIVGIKIVDEYRDHTTFYISDKIMDKLRFNANEEYSEMKILFEGKFYESAYYNNHVEPTSIVPSGYAYISDNLSYLCPNYNCNNRDINVYAINIYYNEDLYLKVGKVYTEKNYKKLLNINDKFDMLNDAIFINDGDYNRLFNKGVYQSSVFVDNEDNASEVASILNDMGFKVLVMKDNILNPAATATVILKIFSTILTIGLIVALFFISYFVIKIILKSRSIYFTTIRILGANKCIAKQILDLELGINASIAYILCLVILYLIKIGVIINPSISDLLLYVGPYEFVGTYIILIIMSQLISNRFSRKIFKNSVMKTLIEEAK